MCCGRPSYEYFIRECAPISTPKCMETARSLFASIAFMSCERRAHDHAVPEMPPSLPHTSPISHSGRGRKPCYTFHKLGSLLHMLERARLPPASARKTPEWSAMYSVRSLERPRQRSGLGLGVVSDDCHVSWAGWEGELARSSQSGISSPPSRPSCALALLLDAARDPLNLARGYGILDMPRHAAHDVLQTDANMLVCRDPQHVAVTLVLSVSARCAHRCAGL